MASWYGNTSKDDRIKGSTWLRRQSSHSLRSLGGASQDRGVRQTNTAVMGGYQNKNKYWERDGCPTDTMYRVASLSEVSIASLFLITPFDHLRYGFIYDNYTSLWNVLDYCASTIPVTSVSQDEDAKYDYEGRNATETEVWNDCRCHSDSRSLFKHQLTFKSFSCRLQRSSCRCTTRRSPVE